MSPGVGMMIRGLRMGYCWSAKHGCFVRLTGGDNGEPFMCEVHPLELIPNARKTGRLHWVWWEKDNAIDLDGIEALRNIVKVKRPFNFYFDNDGKTV